VSCLHLTLWRLALLLDHLVLFVDDLPTAIARFESHGFTVTPGGTNGPTHNALIVFSDGTYIELISLQSSRIRFLMRLIGRIGVFALRGQFKKDLQTRLLRWMSGPEGLIDLCFRGADLTTIGQTSPLKGTHLTDPVKFKRHRPDGVVVEWTLRGSQDSRQPFYIQDSTPIEYRIPTGSARVHKNGAQRLLEVHTSHAIEVSASNVTIKKDPALPAGSMSLIIVSEQDVTDHIDDDSLSNSNIKLVSSTSTLIGM
jgi:hypothetical protein